MSCQSQLFNGTALLHFLKMQQSNWKYLLLPRVFFEILSSDLEVCWADSDIESTYKYVWEVLQKCNTIFLQTPLVFQVDTVRKIQKPFSLDIWVILSEINFNGNKKYWCKLHPFVKGNPALLNL